MLVLMRRAGEALRIGELGDIYLKVISVERGRVRIGISAPTSIPILRQEVWDRINLAKEERDKSNANNLQTDSKADSQTSTKTDKS